MTEITCIVCPKGCRLVVDEENDYAVTGNSCPRGAEYGRAERKNPVRVLTSTVRLRGGLYPRCPVRTEAPLPKALIFEAMRLLEAVELEAPVREGQAVIEDILGTGTRFVATKDMPKC